MGKTRQSANLVSDNNISVDIVNDRVGIGSTTPTTKLDIGGAIKATSFSGSNINLSGVITATSFSGSGANLTGVNIGTASNVNTTGIITASRFFGDGSALTGIINGVGVQSGGVSVASGIVTTLNFVGTGNTFSYNPSTKTVSVSIQGGGGSGGGEIDITASLFS